MSAAQARTVRVRIAVAVDAHGNWDCATRPDDATAFLLDERPIQHEGAAHTIHWIGADVPLARAAVIEGEATTEPKETP